MYVSDLIGSPIADAAGQRTGRVRDVVIRVQGDAPVAGLIVRDRKKDRFLPIGQVARLAAGGVTLHPANTTSAIFIRQSDQVLLGRDVMDGEVIDVPGTRLVRVADVIVEHIDGAWRVAGITAGLGAVMRRLLPRRLRRMRRAGTLLSWGDLELLACEVPGGVTPDHRRLARLHPADIARLADAAPARLATEIVASLDDDLAADTMEEMIDEKQADVVEALDPSRAADILERMAPDAAADVLAELEPDLVHGVLARMEPAEAADVHALLTYPRNTAGGLMTTDLVLAPRGLRIGDALTYLRPQLEKPDWVYYVYVVDDTSERRLAGVFSLRDLLLAGTDQCVDDIMTTVPRRVTPETPAATVARIMSEYNLAALPVTDDEDRLLGIVSVDDALEIILPHALRRRLPRVFS